MPRGWAATLYDRDGGKLRTIITALSRRSYADPEVMQRMQLHAPRGLQQRLFARLMALALAETRID